MTALLAHAGIEAGEFSLALSIVALVAMIVPFVVLAVVARIFWQAKRRDDAAKAREIGGSTGDVVPAVDDR